jgi:hypothetical protein
MGQGKHQSKLMVLWAAAGRFNPEATMGRDEGMCHRLGYGQPAIDVEGR